MTFDQRNAEQPGQQRLPPRHDAFDREIGAHQLLVDRVARLAQLVRGEADVPGLQIIDAQLRGGKCPQLGKVPLRGRLGPARQVAQEGQYLARIGCHLGGERPFDGIGKAQQPGGLMTQLQDAGDARRIIELSSIRPLIRSARSRRAIDPRPQIAVRREGQDGVDAGLLQRDQPAVEPLGLRGGGKHRLVRIRHAIEQRRVGDMLAPAFGRIQHRAAEGVGQRRQFDRDVAKAVAIPGIQRHARQAEIAHRMLYRDTIGHRQGGEIGRCRQADEDVIEVSVLPDGDAMFGQPTLRFGVRRANVGRVGDAVQVRDCRPDRVDARVRPLIGEPYGREIGGLRRLDRGNRRLMLGERHVQRRRDHFGRDLGETGQRIGIEQRIGRRSIHRADKAARATNRKSELTIGPSIVRMTGWRTGVQDTGISNAPTGSPASSVRLVITLSPHA